jgi:transcriptional regulator with XRE-family HTH domain
MDNLRTIEDLCKDQGLDANQLAARAGLDGQRVLAIMQGRWTPSPSERDRLASALGVARDQIAWGHKTPVQHLYGHGPQFGRTP